MKTKNPYDVALLDGDLLILPPSTYETLEPQRLSDTPQSAAASALVKSILDKMYKRESELPYLFLQWAE